MNISAVVLTKNEEKNIASCLKSLSWCNEIIVIDDNSKDNTIQLAKKYNAKVYVRDLGNNFAQQRNFALEKATNEWVLFVDADEEVSQQLQLEIEKKLKIEENVNGFFLKRKDTMWRKILAHGEQGNVQLLRLAKKNTGKWIHGVHEVWDIKGKIILLENPLLHFPHPTLADFLAEINLYSTLRAEELYKNGTRANWISILVYAKGKFIQDYFLKLGFLDGTQGFLVAMVMSFYSFLVRGKLWQLGKK